MPAPSLEATLKPLQNPTAEPKRRPFEGVNLSAAGRLGGIASGRSRRLREIREAERRLREESKNGAALYGWIRLQTEREQELRKARLDADATLSWLLDEADVQRQAVEALKARAEALVDEAEQRIAALEQREAELREAAQADESALLDRLRELHEAGKLEPLLVALDLFDLIDDREPA